MLKTLALSFLLLSALSCDSARETSDSEIDAIDEDVAVASSVSVDQRKLTKKGFITFQTDNLSNDRQRILGAIEQYDAYVTSDQENTYPGQTTHTLTVRVPSEHFDDLLVAVTQEVDQLENREVTVEDVTAEFLDIQARLKTKKALEARYLSLLEQTQAVSEILEIERQAAQLRGDIESIEGRLNYLKDQVAYSTLTITFYKTISTATAASNRFADGFRNGWDNLLWFFVGLINVWPFILLGVAAVIGLRWWRKKDRLSEK